MILTWLAKKLATAPTGLMFVFRCQGCGAWRLNPVYLQNHRACCDRYMAYWAEERALEDEYERRRPGGCGALTREVFLEFESRRRALQSIYAAGWDPGVHLATWTPLWKQLEQEAEAGRRGETAA